MINQYHILDYTPLGIPSVLVKGNAFHYLDLFEFVGRQQFMTTFYLMDGSKARNEYGESVLGVIYYEFKNIEKLNNNKTDGIDLDKIIIDSPEKGLSLNKRSELKYGGVKVTDIESIAFLPYKPFKNKAELYDTGEKKAPNIVEVKLKDKIPNVDIMYRNHLEIKYKQGVKLIQFEKEQLIGITLGIYGEIDYRILNDLGFDDDSIKENLNIWKHLYKFKERRGKLSDEEKERYNDIKCIQWMSICTKILKEIIKTSSIGEELHKNPDVLKKIMESCKSFDPNILLYGKKQVYWDIDSYLHIIMRHVTDYQLGNFKGKTPFPYRASDLKYSLKKLSSVCKTNMTRTYLRNQIRFFIALVLRL